MVLVMLMFILIVEYFLLTLFFLTLIFISNKQSRSNKLLAVKNLRHLCKTEIEMKMYDELQKRGIYVSPEVKCGYCTIPIAIEPYKIAIFTYPSKKSKIFWQLRLKHTQFYLRSFGWKVIKFPKETVQNDFDVVLKKILNKVNIKQSNY